MGKKGNTLEINEFFKKSEKKNLWMTLDKFKLGVTIWKDKRIPKEAKYIYSYIYSKGYTRYITNLNIGEIQQIVKIKNKGLRKNLEILEKLNYLVYQEYSNGMYTKTLN